MHNNDRTTMVYPGSRVVTTAGDVVTVAYVAPDGGVHAWRGNSPWPVPVRVAHDAWGSESDQTVGLAAA